MSCANSFRPMRGRLAVLAVLATTLLSGCATVGGPGGDSAARDSVEGQQHQQAVAAIAAGDVARAEQLFTELTRNYPDYATPWLNLALLQYRRGDPNSAAANVDAALQRDDQLAPAWNLQGVLAREINNIDAAERAYRQAIAVDASYAPAWLNLGILLDIWRGQLSAALSAYERYVELSPEDQRDSRVAGWIADLQRRLDRGA